MSPEGQFGFVSDVDLKGSERLGIHTGYGWEFDPKRFAFTASRYKFVAKMVEGLSSVLEVGCGDAFFSRIVKQHLAPDSTLQAIDINRTYIGEAIKKNNPKDGRWRVWLGDWDIMAGPLAPSQKFDAVYSLDLFEHIEDEDTFLKNLSLCAPLCIVGTPSLESQAHASPISKAEHINCKTKAGLRYSMKQHFKHVLMFGMTDEVIHTGFDPFCPYLFAIGCN